MSDVGWTVQEYSGVEVFRAPEGLSEEEVLDRAAWPKDFELLPLKKEILKVGDIVLVPGAFGGMYVGTVQGDTAGNPYFRSYGGSVMGPLEFGRDDRESWTCVGLGNIEALRRLELR